MTVFKAEPETKDPSKRLNSKMKVLGIICVMAGLVCFAVAVLYRETSLAFLGFPSLGLIGLGWYLIEK
jgi:uncharacterized membrane protein